MNFQIWPYLVTIPPMPKTKTVIKKHDHDHDHKHEHNPMIADNDSIELSIKWPEVDKAYKNILAQAAKGVKIDGFRKGKVPAGIAENKLDPEQLISKTLEKLVPPILQAEFAKLKDKFQPVSRPEVSPIKTNKGEDWQVKVNFAQKPKVNLSKYQTIVKQAKKLALEEIKKIEDLGSKDKKIKKEVKKLTKDQIDDITLRIIFRELIKEIKPAIQEILVREETNYKLQDLAQQLHQIKMNIEDYLERRKIKFEEFAAQIQVEALTTLQLEFTINAISEAEKITVSDQEIKAEIAKIKDENMKKAYQSNEYYQIKLKQNLIRKKTIAHLLSI